MFYNKRKVKLKLSSLKGSLQATMILVLGKCFKMSSEAFAGEIKGFSVIEQFLKEVQPE